MSPRDELARVEALQRTFARPRPDVLVGIGDDAAVLTACTGDLVLSVDVQVEDVHFRRGWLSMRDLGWRAVNAALSDLAAMGAEARGVLLSLVLPGDFDDDELDALVQGAAVACDQAGTSVVGGNLARGGELSVTTTVIGDATGPSLTRAGAAAGDGVFVTGALGASALAVAAFEAGRGDEEVFGPFVARFRRPVARLALGRQIRMLATAAADISDGLIADLGQVCRPSRVGARIDTSLVPTLPGHAAAAGLLGRDPVHLALAGGEDYELVFTAKVSVATQIGVITEEQDVVCLDEGGVALSGTFGGFDHF
ncbi:MAG: thiamine-phosphate kinase [Deltaproteobacteria bacterium]|nr:thiamine-phosphate kinase [Deltaproteobacteria bacterium]